MSELLIFILLVLLWCSFYILFRNKKVCDFRIKVINDAYNFEIKNDTFDDYMCRAEQIVDKTTYDKMLYSFRPLTYEEWFDEDEIKFLTEHIL